MLILSKLSKIVHLKCLVVVWHLIGNIIILIHPNSYIGNEVVDAKREESVLP